MRPCRSVDSLVPDDFVMCEVVTECEGLPTGSPHILLVDDVMTTGATAARSHGLLKRSGAARVTVMVVARTPNS